jgi:predicted DNA-binding WGR domain protein
MENEGVISLAKEAVVSAGSQRWLLRRINPAKNEARFYLVSVGASLLEPQAVLRIWGRIGGQQRAMVTPCQTLAEAQARAEALIRRRLRRGYVIVPGALSQAEAANSGAEPRMAAWLRQALFEEGDGQRLDAPEQGR